MDQARIERLKNNEKLDEIIGEMANAYGQDIDRPEFYDYLDWIEYLESHINGLDAITELIELIGEVLGIDLSYSVGEALYNQNRLQEELESVHSEWVAKEEEKK